MQTDDDLRQEIAKEVLLMDCPTISGRFEDPWQMFLWVRNKSIDVITNGKGLQFDE